MRITLSFFLIFTIIVVALLFMKRLRVAAFLVSAVWGFLLAQTAFAPGVNSFLTSLGRLFGGQ
jgi:hypothetical protein